MKPMRKNSQLSAHKLNAKQESEPRNILRSMKSEDVWRLVTLKNSTLFSREMWMVQWKHLPTPCSNFQQKKFKSELFIREWVQFLNLMCCWQRPPMQLLSGLTFVLQQMQEKLQIRRELTFVFTPSSITRLKKS